MKTTSFYYKNFLNQKKPKIISKEISIFRVIYLQLAEAWINNYNNLLEKPVALIGGWVKGLSALKLLEAT